MATRQDFTSGQVLTAAELDAVATAMIAINAQTGTTYTTVLADDGKLVTCDNAASIALTIPPNSSVAYGIGTQINIMQLRRWHSNYHCRCRRDASKRWQ
jgi:hypothetical protein